MEYRRLGLSGLKLSALSLGNWATHGVQVDERQSVALVNEALAVGMNSFDTSDSYGDTLAETILGRAVKNQSRESFVISTKCFWPTGAGVNERGLSRKHILEACEASLRRLTTDYIDIYFAHRFDPGVPLEETLHAFDDLVRQGKILYVGVSEWTAEQITEAVRICAWRGFVPISAIQSQYSMLWRAIEQEIEPTCHAFGIGQVAWSPLAQGVLTGKYHPAKPPPAGSRGLDPSGAEYIRRWMTPEVLAAVSQLVPIAEELSVSPAQLALAWVLGRPGVTSAIIGASRPEQIRENAGAIGAVIPAEFQQRIDEILFDVIRWEKPKLLAHDPSLMLRSLD